jgi:hypothetical protein
LRDRFDPSVEEFDGGNTLRTMALLRISGQQNLRSLG